MLMLELFLVWLAIVFVSETIVIYLCHRWGHDPAGWTLLAMAMGPIAIVGLIGTRQRDVEHATMAQDLSAPDDDGHGSIVVACDGSAATRSLAEHLLARCDPDSEMILVAVLPHEAVPREDAASQRERDERVERMTGEASALLRERGRRFRVIARYGHPGEEILLVAEACEAALILVGRRGAGLSRLLGSVSGYVVSRAQRPVTVVT